MKKINELDGNKVCLKGEIFCQIRRGNKRLSDGMEMHKGSKKVKGKVIFLKKKSIFVGRLDL